MLFVAVIGCWQETYRYLAGKRDTLLATANAFSAASAEAVALRDSRGAYLAIRGIKSLPSIEYAAIWDKDGRSLADIGSGVRLAGDLDITEGSAGANPFGLLNTRTVSVTVDVRKGGLVAGRLKLVGAFTDLWTRLRDVLLITSGGGLVAFLIGLMISLRVQRSITRPLIALTRAMGAIETRHTYDTRVRIESDDEVGLLAESFNAMLGEVQKRDEWLIAHRDQLEQDVADRTHDLRSAKEDAEAANVAKSTFLATMSHEIRTPMTGMLVMAELLASDDLPTRSRRHAEVICKSGTALLAIINDILDFSKIEAGKLETEKVAVDVRDVVNTSIALFYSRAVDKGLDLAARFDPGVPTIVEGDPTRLQQVLGNLVNNALKFTGNGHVLVEVGYRDDALVLDVHDTGIGIPPNKLDRIFQAFSQADGSTTREFGGTGLGLSISSRLAEAMGGAITVASVEGAGSTFTCSVPARRLEDASDRIPTPHRGEAVLLLSRPATSRAVADAVIAAGFDIRSSLDATHGPVALVVIDAEWTSGASACTDANTIVIHFCAPDEAAPHAASGVRLLRLPFVEAEFAASLDADADGSARPAPMGLASVSSKTLAGARVLVADDTAVNREVMIEALSRHGIVPDLAVNGLEALQMASSVSYDLVFMDGSMPELDGFEACRRLRAHETAQGSASRTQVVALTAHVVGTAADAWREAGMDGVLHKPFTMAELQRTLTGHIRREATDFPLEVEPQRTRAEMGPDDLSTETKEDVLLDEAVLSEIAGVSRDTRHDFARRVFGLYIEHAPRVVDDILAAHAASDHDALAAAAHAIKSMSLNIGARRAGSVAGDVERSARAGKADSGEIDAIGRAVAMTCDALAARLTDLGTARATGAAA